MQIDKRKIDDVTVFDLKGKMTLGEGDELLNDEINRLSEHDVKKVVLNLRDIRYADSAGQAEIVRTWSTIRRRGGKPILCHPSIRFLSFYSITKLIRVYDIVPTVEDAIAAFRTPHYVRIACPCCPAGQVEHPMTSIYDDHICDICGAKFRLHELLGSVSGTEEVTAVLSHISVPAHESEFVTLELAEWGAHCGVHLPRRFDLFASEALRQAWNIIQLPQWVVIDARALTVMTERARAILRECCEDSRAEGCVWIYVDERDPAEHLRRMLDGLPVRETWKQLSAAWAANGAGRISALRQLTTRLSRLA